jgi:imidazole glycerol-phosphate synthase subunit HisF
MRARVIPTLLVAGGGLVKSVRFKDRTYLGDPINAVRLYNDMEVDEILVVDITASREGRGPDLGFIREFASEAFMPFGYGGGVSSVEQMHELFNSGVEKVALNHALLTNISLLGQAAARFGSQSVVGCLDVKRDLLGRRRVYDHLRRKTLSLSPADYARRLESEGAGEILVYDVDRDGMMQGYDLELAREVSGAVTVPVIASGGAGSLGDLAAVVGAGAAAAAAGSIFVYQSKQKGVLINYPSQDELERIFGQA